MVAAVVFLVASAGAVVSGKMTDAGWEVLVSQPFAPMPTPLVAMKRRKRVETWNVRDWWISKRKKSSEIDQWERASLASRSMKMAPMLKLREERKLEDERVLEK